MFPIGHKTEHERGTNLTVTHHRLRVRWNSFMVGIARVPISQGSWTKRCWNQNDTFISAELAAQTIWVFNLGPLSYDIKIERFTDLRRENH